MSLKLVPLLGMKIVLLMGVAGGVVCLVKTTVVMDEPIDLPEFLDILPPTKKMPLT